MHFKPEVNVIAIHVSIIFEKIINNSIFTHMSSDIIVYPMMTRDRAKVTASKTRNNKFILDALNGLIDGWQFITTLVYSEEKKTYSHTSCKLMVFTNQQLKINISVYSMAEWFRVLDLKSGGPWFKSSTQLLSEFVLGSPVLNSSTAFV